MSNLYADVSDCSGKKLLKTLIDQVENNWTDGNTLNFYTNSNFGIAKNKSFTITEETTNISYSGYKLFYVEVKPQSIQTGSGIIYFLTRNGKFVDYSYKNSSLRKQFSSSIFKTKWWKYYENGFNREDFSLLEIAACVLFTFEVARRRSDEQSHPNLQKRYPLKRKEVDQALFSYLMGNSRPDEKYEAQVSNLFLRFLNYQALLYSKVAI